MLICHGMDCIGPGQRRINDIWVHNSGAFDACDGSEIVEPTGMNQRVRSVAQH